MYVTKEQIANRRTMKDELWWLLCSFKMSEPVPLHKADLTKPFIYDRNFGVFYVPFGLHQAAMSLLLAWHFDTRTYLDLDVAALFGLRDHDTGELSERFLMMSGTCFKSGVGKQIICYKKSNLNETELDYFHPLRELQ